MRLKAQGSYFIVAVEPSMEDIDAIVVGAGVIGLAAAYTLVTAGRSVCILEREPRAGMGTSTHNSQVIHAGFYYPVGSLKARHCVAGNPLIYEFCLRHGVPHARCGKLVVAQDDAEMAVLDGLAAKGRNNGVEGLTFVDREAIRAREPHIRAEAALLSSTTGIVDAEAFVRTLTRLCEEQDAFVLPGSPLIGAEPGAQRITVRTPAETIRARVVVNAAGLYADAVSSMLGGEWYTIHPCRGEYAELVPARRGLVNHLVYPVPHVHGLGVHLTKTTHGNVTLGPTARFQDRKDDYEGDRLSIDAFLAPARALLPSLTIDDLRLGGSGIRPKLHGPDVPFADFLIARDAKCPRLIQAAGIESPGLTACLSIGQHVAALAAEVLD